MSKATAWQASLEFEMIYERKRDKENDVLADWLDKGDSVPLNVGRTSDCVGLS